MGPFIISLGNYTYLAPKQLVCQPHLMRHMAVGWVHPAVFVQHLLGGCRGHQRSAQHAGQRRRGDERGHAAEREVQGGRAVHRPGLTVVELQEKAGAGGGGAGANAAMLSMFFVSMQIVSEVVNVVSYRALGDVQRIGMAVPMHGFECSTESRFDGHSDMLVHKSSIHAVAHLAPLILMMAWTVDSTGAKFRYTTVW